MARRDRKNRALFWVDPEFGGVSFLKAAFGSLYFAPHVHEELVIAVTVDGAGRFVTRGLSDLGTPGSVLVFNPDEPHAGGVVDGLGWRYRALYIGRRALQELWGSLTDGRSGAPYFHRTLLGDPELAELILQAHIAHEERTARLARESLLLGAFAHLLQRHGEPGSALPTIGRERGPIRQTLEHMRRHFADDLSVETLACLARMSSFRFIRAFRQELGLPPHAYLMQLRLGEAKRLLARGEAPAGAALAAGFYDQSHLTKSFKRAYGITPGQYAAALQ